MLLLYTSMCMCLSCGTWRDGHVVLFGVASPHGAHTVQTGGGDDGVGLGQRCEGCCGRGGGLGQAQRRRRLRG